MRVALLLVVLAVLAGCAGSATEITGPTASTATTAPPSTATETIGPPATETETTTAPARTVAAAGTTEQPDATPTAAPTPTGPANPWGKRPVVVGIDDGSRSDRNYTRPVRRAIEYWRTDGERAATWNPAFVLRPDASDPDVVVRFVDDVRRCHRSVDDDIVGCAPLLPPDATPPDPALVRVDGGLDDESTYLTVRHEFGHVLGLRHGDEPTAVMAHRVAVSRALRDRYTVAVVFEDDVINQDRTVRQVEQAVDYYDAGAGGWLEQEVSFELVEGDADVTIRVSDDPSRTSIGYRDNMTIHVDGVLHTRHGWHVGYWLGYLLGSESPDDMPPAFDEPETDEREEWW